jgi:O-antigen/teichoic acid export membrane protein
MTNRKLKIKQFFGDTLLYLLAGVVDLGVVQLIVFPILARVVSEAEFGTITTLYGINTVIILVCGSTLGTLRLLSPTEDYDDYQLLALCLSLISFLVSILLFNLYGEDTSLFDIFAYALATVVQTYIYYGATLYRKVLRINQFLYMRVVGVIGYLLGLVAWNLTNHWSLIFVVGMGLSLVYLNATTRILFEPLNRSKNLGNKVRELASLGQSNFVNQLLVNWDRFILIPILGPTSAGYYFSASVISKMINLITNPLTQVLLSYLVNSNLKIKKKKLLEIQLIAFAISLVLSPIVFGVSDVAVRYLYPQLLSGYKNYKLLLILLSIAFTVSAMANMINTILLRFYHLKLQLYVSMIYGIIFCILSIFLSIRYGVIGYGVAFLIGILIKTVLQMFFSLKMTIKSDEE